jgi:DNA-binding LacI/PurR family transcriptional regulator
MGQAAGSGLRIALLLESLDDEYEAGVLHGAYERVKQTDATLLAFAGGVVDAPESDRKARNVIFDLVSPHTSDAVLVLASAIGNALGPAGLVAWLERLRPMRMCSLGVGLPGLAQVEVDSRVGMAEATRHLTQEHRVHRVAFIRGPRASPEAQARYEAVSSTLAESGLELDDSFVADGDYTRASGARAVRTLLDERRIHVSTIDALIAASDNMALGALDELLRRGVAVPESLALVGFDDVEAGQQVHPALTTVHQPMEELGARGVDTLLALGSGIAPPAPPLPTRLVVRQSCGCSPEEAKLWPERKSYAAELAPSLEAALVGRRQVLSVELLRAARGTLTGAGPGWEALLVEALYAEARGTARGALPRAVDQLVRRVLRGNGELGLIQDLVTTLRTNVLPCVRGDRAARDRVEDALHAARLLAGAHLTRRAVEHASEYGTRLHDLARAAEFHMLSEDDSLSKLAAAHLPALGVEACVVAAFAEPRDGQCHMILGFDGPRIFHDSAEFPAASLVPPDTFDLHQRSAVVMPLVFGAEVLGFGVFAYGSTHGLVYEQLREVFSTVVKGGLLARELGRLRGRG